VQLIGRKSGGEPLGLRPGDQIIGVEQAAIDVERAGIVKTLRLKLDATGPDDMLAHDEQRRLSEKLGFSWGQKEEFFIDRAAKTEPDPVVEVSGEDMADAVP
jgi:hypothetical protein